MTGGLASVGRRAAEAEPPGEDVGPVGEDLLASPFGEPKGRKHWLFRFYELVTLPFTIHFLLSSPRIDPSYGLTAWRRFRIEARGPSLRFLIDGLPVLATTDTTYPTGEFGIGYNTKGFERALFDPNGDVGGLLQGLFLMSGAARLLVAVLLLPVIREVREVKSFGGVLVRVANLFATRGMRLSVYNGVAPEERAREEEEDAASPG